MKNIPCATFTPFCKDGFYSSESPQFEVLSVTAFDVQQETNTSFISLIVSWHQILVVA